MPPSVFPWISEPDYPGFQKLISELQKVSYAEWMDDYGKAIAYRRLRNGSVDIPVSPDGFAAWARQMKVAMHLELLWTYAETKAGKSVIVQD